MCKNICCGVKYKSTSALQYLVTLIVDASNINAFLLTSINNRLLMQKVYLYRVSQNSRFKIL